MRFACRSLLTAALLSLGALAPSVASAVTSASFTFDFTTDPGDVGDGPDYDVTGVGPIDDGLGCDSVVMIMVDATGTVTDSDSFCLSLVDGTGGSDGDYGSFETFYVPVAGPVTYALYDLTAADVTALSDAGLFDNNQGYVDYVIANCALLAEDSFPVQGLVSGTPFSFALSGASYQCYQGKDLKSPKFVPVDDVAVADAFGSSTVDVKKPSMVCAPAGVDGAAAPTGVPNVCCYKMKGTKLSPAAEIQTEDSLGTLQLRVQTPKLFCTACTSGPIPLP